MEPTLGVMDLIQSLTFENGDLHCGEIQGLAAKVTLPPRDPAQRSLHLFPPSPAQRSPAPDIILSCWEYAWAL